LSTTLRFEGGEFMKKIILAVIAGTMLLSNVAFASTKTTHTNTVKTTTVFSVKQNSMYYLNTTDPH